MRQSRLEGSGSSGFSAVGQERERGELKHMNAKSWHEKQLTFSIGGKSKGSGAPSRRELMLMDWGKRDVGGWEVMALEREGEVQG
jgi:hypothetical protein